MQLAGRKLAPFLRVLLPSWWLARFDSHADAAAAAERALRDAFPGPKQREALLFCRSEVLAIGKLVFCVGHLNADRKHTLIILQLSASHATPATAEVWSCNHASVANDWQFGKF